MTPINNLDVFNVIIPYGIYISVEITTIYEFLKRNMGSTVVLCVF